MNAKDLAAAAVEKGKSIRKAAREFGISHATLQSHLTLLKRPCLLDVVQRESLISAAMESVRAKRLAILGAAKTYGIPYQTLHGRIKNRSNKRGRKTKFTDEEEKVLVDIMTKLATLHVTFRFTVISEIKPPPSTRSP